ncbi:RNA polymerase factor sigma-54 [Sedimentitalea todarodis]|uniref:RNA polymerase sigma-54 factor n=1 Tax=Sedimentitalea todarodis TaxID=1631240 RepID=A0ABU3VE47_9RHOB|nr:RNA polymerase factor sigma-54 [Sedimentitalea todarodis]MDU9004452.1 RNA polymerase factor sigma-54 [Sedimentitalea todarodis]
MKSAYTHLIRQTGTLNHAMMQTAKVMRMNGLELQEHLATTVERNPFVDIDRGVQGTGTSKDVWTEREIPSDTRTSLYRHLACQFPLVFDNDTDMRVALVFLEEVDPNGWLAVPVEHLAQTSGFDPADCERVLGQLQTLEPAGVFARDLKECLRLQAMDRGLLDEVMAALITHLDLLLTHELPKLARRLNTDPQSLAKRLEHIRRMDPKPGQAFSFDTVTQTASDVLVSVTDQGLSFELSRSSFPTIRMSPAFGVNGQTQSPHRAELIELVREAKALRTAVEMRRSTTLLVVAAIFTRQRDFLAHGYTALCPMRMGDIADDVSVSEATVSRIVSGLTIQCPLGNIKAKSLFCSPVSMCDQPKTRHVALQMIKTLIADEDKNAPLSDRKITALLQNAGIEVSRRTITKYRHSLGLEAPGIRRKNAKLSELTAHVRVADGCRRGDLRRSGRDG